MAQLAFEDEDEATFRPGVAAVLEPKGLHCDHDSRTIRVGCESDCEVEYRLCYEARD